MFTVAEDFAGKTEDEIEMMKCMGFGGFETTKVRCYYLSLRVQAFLRSGDNT